MSAQYYPPIWNHHTGAFEAYSEWMLECPDYVFTKELRATLNVEIEARAIAARAAKELTRSGRSA